MRSGFIDRLNDVPNAIRDIVNGVLKEYIEIIYNESQAKAPDEAKGKYTISVTPNQMRVELWTEDEMAAYLEFGTGRYAVKLLSGKPKEMSSDAILFFKTGEGTLPASPYLFPTYYRYKDKIAIEADKRIQRYLDKL